MKLFGAIIVLCVAVKSNGAAPSKTFDAIVNKAEDDVSPTRTINHRHLEQTSLLRSHLLSGNWIGNSNRTTINGTTNPTSTPIETSSSSKSPTISNVPSGGAPVQEETKPTEVPLQEAAFTVDDAVDASKEDDPVAAAPDKDEAANLDNTNTLAKATKVFKGKVPKADKMSVRHETKAETMSVRHEAKSKAEKMVDAKAEKKHSMVKIDNEDT